MIKASQVSMGFLRSLYYEQVQKSIADAKKERARQVTEQARQDKQRDLALRRQISASRNKRHIKPVEIDRPQQPQRRSMNNKPPANISAEDFVEALEEME